ncbi:MAG: hypothetical protein JO032_19855 [Alphaproteobacteria bacterium]|nr:hypothetical protein [Alphaproteobacteria bacterium]
MTRYALAVAALALSSLTPGVPAVAQSLCDRPAAQLSATQLDACRASSVLVVEPPRVENHRDGVTILRGQ